VRYFILFCVAGCLAGAGEALADTSADAPDCDAIKTSLIPYQIKLTKEHSVWRELHTIQMVRDQSGADTISGRVNSTTSYKYKSIAWNGSRIENDRQYFRGESSSRIDHWTNEYEGVDPKQMDYRIDQNFLFNEKFKGPDSKDPDLIRSYEASYRYQKTENVPIGSCTFLAHIGETTLTDRKGGQVRKFSSWYFPDLRLLLGNPSSDIIFQSISTTFEPIEFAVPNWPPAPSKADNH
jgi:hypothetical protein